MRFFLPQVLHVRITDIHILQLPTCHGVTVRPLVVAGREIADPILFQAAEKRRILKGPIQVFAGLEQNSLFAHSFADRFRIANR
jgi:hypothetical protein